MRKVWNIMKIYVQKIDKYSHYDNLKKRDILQECHYPDNTLLDSTEFNENNIMYVSFDKNRNCTCGKIHGAKAVSNVLTKKFEGQLEQEKKILQDNFNLKAEEIKKRNEDNLNRIKNDFQDKIQKQKKENMELRWEMNKNNIEYEDKIKRMTKINEEKNKKNEEKIQKLDNTLKEFDEKEKTFIQNKISAGNEYNKSYPEIFQSFYNDEKDTIIQDILKEMSRFLTKELSFDDLVEEIIPKIAKKEKF